MEALAREAAATELRLAFARVAFGALLTLPATVGHQDLLRRQPEIAQSLPTILQSAWITAIALGVYIGAAVLYLMHCRRRAAAGIPPSMLRRNLATVFDIALLTAVTIPPLSLLGPSGIPEIYLVPFCMLLIPCFLHSFRLDDDRWRALGAVLSAAGFLVLFLVVRPRGADDPQSLGLAPQLIAVTMLFGFVHIIGSMKSRRARELIAEGARRAVWRDRLARFLPPQAIERLEAEGGVRMGGDEQIVAILLIDVRGFTAMAERLPPAEVVKTLNDYFTHMVGGIFEHGGSLDKFMGDAILAVFGAPLPEDERAPAAVRCALALRERLAAHNAERAARKEPPLATVSCVHYGRVVRGWLGSEDRPEYTVIGDTVNAASRLEGIAKELNEAVVVSEEAADACGKAFSWRALGTHVVKGRERPLAIYATSA